jgi:hypothetical protein
MQQPTVLQDRNRFGVVEVFPQSRIPRSYTSSCKNALAPALSTLSPLALRSRPDETITGIDERSRFVFKISGTTNPLSRTTNPSPDGKAKSSTIKSGRMFPCFRNGFYAVLCTMIIMAIRLETYLEDQPNVGTVIHDKNVFSIHLAAIFTRETARERKKIATRSFGVFLPYFITG